MSSLLLALNLLLGFSPISFSKATPIVKNAFKCNYFEDVKNPQKQNEMTIVAYSEGIIDVIEYLNNNYPDYNWKLMVSKSTEDISGTKPIEMKNSDLFPMSDIEKAVKITGVPSSYGGCGPIALMGILDYFSRYRGYKEIMNNPYSEDDRVKMAVEVLNESNTFEFFGSTVMLCSSYVSAFNNLMELYGLDGVIEAEGYFNLGFDLYHNYWNIVVENVDKGIPLTFMTSGLSGEGDFGGHYTNVFGYETWVGYHKETNERVEKNFIIARPNLYTTDVVEYCDAMIFNDLYIGLITFNINYNCCSQINASDFAQEFVNNSGDGQYYFYNKSTEVTTSGGETLHTNRLRASFIENQYLVLSPNRVNAGTAYIDIEFEHSVEKMVFDAALWSNNEGVAGQKFEIQYYSDGKWETARTIDLYKMNTKNIGMNSYLVLFPKTTKRIRFITIKQNPQIDRNKGRIVLDRIKIYYN